MKVKSWLRYFICIFIIIILIFLCQQISGLINRSAQTYNFLPHYAFIKIIFYLVVSFLLGTEHLIGEMKKEGSWSINLPKLIIMGLPSLYFSLAVFTFYCGTEFMWNVFLYLMNYLNVNGTNFISVFPLVLGYSIITSFYKTRDINACS